MGQTPTQAANLRTLHMITFSLLIIGGLNWLVFGLFGWEISAIFGDERRNPVAKIIYAVIGTAALIELGIHLQMCRACGSWLAARRTAPATERES